MYIMLGLGLGFVLEIGLGLRLGIGCRIGMLGGSEVMS